MALLVASPPSADPTITNSVLNTLTASDTFTFQLGDLIHIRNPTGGSLTPIFDGADGNVVPLQGVGLVSVTAGKSIGAIAASAERFVRAEDIIEFLRGVTTITGGTGLIVTIFRR